jgi:polar amino acid transport system permease protein
MTRFQAIRSILLPQAVRVVIPPWSNELILMLKYSSIVFFATVTDLMGAGLLIAGESFRYFEVFILVAGLYLAVVLALTVILRAIEAWLRVPGLGSAGMEG